MQAGRALCAGLVVVLAVLAAGAGTAHGAERAQLTWDTDETDVDLHVFDEYGNHAWFGDQEGIPAAELSQDIVDGFGPEHFEEFSGAEGYSYSYAICYYASNRDDGVVPPTVATVKLTDPDGGVRSFRRVLSSTGEAYVIGSSPSGAPNFVPAGGGWCRDGRGPIHPAEDTGPADATAPGTFESCGRERRRLGPVEICANSFDVDGRVYAARGDVRLNGSVALGDGPIDVSTDAQTIVSRGSAPVGVRHGGALVPVATGQVRVTAKPVSAVGRTGLAEMRISAPQFQGLKMAGIGVQLFDPDAPLYVDPLDGGGLIVPARLALPLFANKLSAEAVTVGIHGGGKAPVKLLAGSVKFGGWDFGGGWKFSELELAYSAGTNTWTAKGGLTTPALGLDVGGTLADGQLDALNASVSRDVPLGTSGFILSKVGGGVAGLARPPLKLSASIAGRWGSVPKLRTAVMMFDDVTLTLDLSGKASLDGKVSLVKSNGPVTGQLRLAMAITPFAASGSFKAGAKVGPVDIAAQTQIALNPQHFTASGEASGSLRGLKIARARSVVSDKGLGASGEVCIGAFGRCVARTAVGLGMNWNEFPDVRWIGGDTDQFVTARASARGVRTITVEPGRPLLFVDADAADGTLADFVITSPTGQRYGTRKERRDSAVVKDPAVGYTGLTILRPKAGRWRIDTRRAPGGTEISTQAIRRISPLRLTSVAPTGSRTRPLARKGGALRLRWSARGYSSRARVDVYLTTDRRSPGTLVAKDRRIRGSFRLKRALVPPGRSYVRLVAHERGVPLGDVVARKAISMKR